LSIYGAVPWDELKEGERFEKLAIFLVLLFSKIFQKRRSKTYSKL